MAGEAHPRPAPRIALVRQVYNPYGGAERFVERALAALRDRGLSVTLIARRWQAAAGVQGITCDPFHLGRLWRDLSFARCARQAWRNGGFDLVQSHERISGCTLYRAGDGVHATWLALRARAEGLPARLAAYMPFHRHLLAAERALFAHPALRAVICNSRMVRDDIHRRFGLAEERLPVIYNGVDLSHFHPGLRAMHRQDVRQQLGIPTQSPVFAFVGSGFARKGVAPALAALAAQPTADAYLVVVGKDRRQRAMQALARRLGVAGRVRFLGGQQDVRPYYGAADCLLLPTLYDPFPNAALEALASGLPVITTATCGAAELIRPGENGAVVDAFDPAALAAAVAALARPGVAAAMAGTARASVESLSLEAMAEQLGRLYERLLDEAARP